MNERPIVLFVCHHNAGRSQLAEALFTQAAAGRALGRSGGTRPATSLHPHVVTALREIGIDTSSLRPKPISAELMEGVGTVVTMGCGDECPAIAGARAIDWNLPDPLGQPLESVRALRDEIGKRVRRLLADVLA